MAADKSGMKRRNIEIGQILQKARAIRTASISECASLLGTSRQRYADIEKGDSYITVVELEQLMEFLSISRDAIWPGGTGESKGYKGSERPRVVRLPVVLNPKESTQLIIELRPGE